MRPITSLVLAIVMTCCAVPVQGCAPFFAALPAVIAAATTAGQVIDTIESFLRSHDVHSKAIDDAMTSAHAALAAVTDAAKGATDIHDANLNAALEAFQEAYEQLLVAVAPFGVSMAPDGGRLAVAGPGTLVVPSPPTMRLSLEGER